MCFVTNNQGKIITCLSYSEYRYITLLMCSGPDIKKKLQQLISSHYDTFLIVFTTNFNYFPL